MRSRQSAPSIEPPIEAKVAFLRRPEAYPERPSRVEPIETHMSWVFLTDRYAYKLKKPVRTAHFDFRDLSARRFNCLEEVRLNRPLAPKVYLGIVPLTIGEAGDLRLGQDGLVVEWLIKMRRLPAERTLEHAIRSHAVAAADIRKVAQVLCAFYGRSAPLNIHPTQYRASFARRIREAESDLRKAAYALPASIIADAAQAGSAFLERDGPLLEARARERRIVEAHGDLRPEHIYLGQDPLIVDRLEFSFSLRALDPADELAYLALECDRLGAPRIGPILFETYRAMVDDEPAPILIAFYKLFRAMVRAVLAAAHLDDPGVRNPEKWRGRAIDYLRAGLRAAERLR